MDTHLKHVFSPGVTLISGICDVCAVTGRIVNVGWVTPRVTTVNAPVLKLPTPGRTNVVPEIGYMQCVSKLLFRE